MQPFFKTYWKTIVVIVVLAVVAALSMDRGGAAVTAQGTSAAGR